MPATTVAQFAAQELPELAQRIANNLVRSSNIMGRIPAIPCGASGVQWNEIDALGSASAAALGTYAIVAASARAAPTWTQKNRRFIPIYSQIDIDAGYVGNEAYTMRQVDLHTERVARFFDNDFINGNGPGDGSGTRLVGLDDTDNIAGSQVLNATGGDPNGDQFDLGMLDQLITKCQHGLGNGMGCFLMHSSYLNSFAKAQRGANGASVTEIINLPNMFTGEMEMQTVEAYRGVPIYFNDHIPSKTKGTGTVRKIYALKFDDGSMTKGLGILTPADQPGFQVLDVGHAESNLGRIIRVMMFTEVVIFNNTSCAAYDNVKLMT